MKRLLKNDHYSLSDQEKHEIWRAVSGDPGGKAPRRRGFVPAFAFTLTATVACLAVVWWAGLDHVVLRPTAPSTRPETGLMGRTSPPATAADRPAVVAMEPAAVEPAAAPPEPRTDAAAGPTGPDTPAAEPSSPQVAVNATVVDEAASGAKSDLNAVSKPLALQVRPEVLAEQEARANEAAKLSTSRDRLYVRGGRSGDVSYQVNLPEGAAPPSPQRPATGPARTEAESRGETKSLVRGRVAPPAADRGQAPGSVTGGTTPPNGERFELMYFSHEGVNPFVATEDDALSTFAVDVDNGSWTLCRNYLERGALPPPDAVRVEEFVNAFDPGYRAQSDDTLVIHADGAPSRFGKGYQLLRVGLDGMVVDASERKPANLVFVVDVSGSMERENRLGAVRWALTMLLDQLQEGDRVGLVVYGSHGEVRLEPTGIEQREKIKAAIAGLVPNGSTNCYEGLKLAYAMARRAYEAGRINRLILCSDGVANNGASTNAEEILALVRESTDAGITLSTVGFGMGNYNDALMEKLADKGDGNYAYVDRRDEAERVFRENLTGTLQTIARQVKVQVEFDPEKVDRWRLLGYENRDVADRDFRNDAVDAGEIGAGHRVTALYEIKLKDRAKGRLGTVRLRWEAPAHDTAHAGEVTEIERPIEARDLKHDFADGDVHFKVQAVAAEFAEILRGSYWAKESDLHDLAVVADAVADEARGTEKLGDQAADLARLIREAARLKADDDARLGRDRDK